MRQNSLKNTTKSSTSKKNKKLKSMNLKEKITRLGDFMKNLERKICKLMTLKPNCIRPRMMQLESKIKKQQSMNKN